MSVPSKVAPTATVTVRAGIESDRQFGAVVPPLHLSSNFSFAGFDAKREYDYTRSGNPTRDLLAEAISDLEGGAGAVVTASGMAAATLALQLLRPGQTLLAPHDGYGGCHRLFTALARRGAFELQFCDQTDDGAFAAALERRPRLVWIETPSNPLMRVVDLRARIEAAHAVGALALVDNTFLSPALQRPIEFGADLVLHSTTKYLNGHSDVVGGCLVAADEGLHEELGWWANCLGLSGAPFDSWLTLRGLRSLHARMAVHERNARALAQFLAEHPAVRRVHYPGLVGDPWHPLAQQQQRGFGGMLSFELHGGEAAVRRFLPGLRLFSLAESLGGVESLVAHPATMTHAAMDAEARAQAGIGPGLLRLSVGIEDGEELLADLRCALDRAQPVSDRVGESASR